MHKILTQGLILAFTFLSIPVHGSHDLRESVFEDILEKALRTCCKAAGSPDSYEKVRASIDCFTDGISTQESTITKMAFLETCFQVPGNVTLKIATFYGNEDAEQISKWHCFQTWKKIPSKVQNDDIQRFLNTIGMQDQAFRALCDEEQNSRFLTYCKENKPSPLQRVKGNTPHMIKATTLHQYLDHRDPKGFPLLYYCFMVTEKEARLDLWELLTSFGSTQNCDAGLESYPDLWDALEGLPYTPFPYPQ